jgi:hypothetical protein
MTHRLSAASAIAILGFGLMLVPGEASARGGGFAGARAWAGPGGFRPALHLRHAHGGPLHHRRWFRYGVPAVWGEPAWSGAQYLLPIYYLISYNQLPDQPAYSVADTGPSVRQDSDLVRSPTCTTQFTKVPSERGGQRTIKVERC